MKIKQALYSSLMGASITLTSPIAYAQETVKGLVCTLAEKCDLEQRTLSTSYRPFDNNFVTDIEERLNVNLHCIQANGVRSVGTQIISDVPYYYHEQQLMPYTFRHPEDADSIFDRLYGKDFDCKFENIEIPSIEQK